MRDIIKEMYRAHRQRVSALQSAMKSVKARIAKVESELENLSEFRTDAEEMEKKWSEKHRPRTRKSQEQKDEEDYIRLVNYEYPKRRYLKLQAELKNLQKKLRRMESSYSVYDLEDIESFNFDVEDNENLSKDKTVVFQGKAMYDIAELPRLEWIPWPSSHEDITIELPGFEMNRLGVGPGEDLLASILGANVQGGGVSYDLLTPDGSKWEVKSLKNSHDQIRPASEGVEAYDEVRSSIVTVMNQLKSFVNSFDEEDIDEIGDDRTRRIVELTRNFIDRFYTTIVKKNEISMKTIDMFYKLISLISEMKKKHNITGENYTISYGGTDRTVDKATYITIMKHLGADVSSTFDTLSIALTGLTSDAFDDPEEFFREVEAGLNIEDVFSQVDGVIIVNKNKGFSIIPRDMLNDVLLWTKVSQGFPRLRYLRF